MQCYPVSPIAFTGATSSPNEMGEFSLLVGIAPYFLNPTIRDAPAKQ